MTGPCLSDVGRGGRPTSMRRCLLGIFVGLVVLLGPVVVYRAEIALAVVAWLAESGRDVGPNRPVPWDQGPPQAAHLAEQVPPRWDSRGAAAIPIDKHRNEPESPDDEFVYSPN